MGSLLQLKPVIKMYDGELGFEGVRTRTRAAKRLVELVSELGPLEELALVYAHAPERARDLWKQAQHLFPQGGAPLCVEVTPVIGAHVGPGAVGFVAVKALEW